MPIHQEDFDRLCELRDRIRGDLDEASMLLRNADKSLYDRWHAYGEQVTDKFVSMGPSLSKCIEKLEGEITSEDDECEDECEDEGVEENINREGGTYVERNDC